MLLTQVSQIIPATAEDNYSQLRVVNEKRPDTFGVSGLFVYSMLTEAGEAVGCKVASAFQAACAS